MCRFLVTVPGALIRSWEVDFDPMAPPRLRRLPPDDWSVCQADRATATLHCPTRQCRRCAGLDGLNISTLQLDLTQIESNGVRVGFTSTGTMPRFKMAVAMSNTISQVR